MRARNKTAFTPLELPVVSHRKRAAFTLVELLVVIGIIALLISILLPSLNSARKAAASVKCAAALREIGNATQMYSLESKGFVPPAKLNGSYNIDGWQFTGTSTNSAYWPNFLAKYVTKTKTGYSSATAAEAADQRRNIFWGCPEWQGYVLASNVGGISLAQNGYAWNAYPEYTQSFPKTNENLNDNAAYPRQNSVIVWTTGNPPQVDTAKCTWYKLTQYTKPSERVLASDGLFWLLQTERPIDDKGTLLGCRVLRNSGAVTTTGATTCDWYRHGKYGSTTADGNYFNAISGKVSYNVLYADGHVASTNDRAQIWRAQRQRYPG